MSESDKDTFFKNFAQEFDADVVAMVGPISYYTTLLVRDCIKERRKRENLYICITTFGGSPDDAYRITRHFQRIYKNITILINSFCKSSGTLVAVGGHELVMSDEAELGPLDIQIVKQEEMGQEYGSGMAYTEALGVLRRESFSTFKYFAKQIREDEEIRLSTKLSIEAASNMVIGLFDPIFEQLDPVRLGENQRDVNIIIEYGSRLQKIGRNLKEEALNKLRGDYPSHGFVIDREEAMRLFNNVRAPSESETRIIDLIDDMFWSSLSRGVVKYLTPEPEKITEDATDPNGEGMTDDAEAGNNGQNDTGAESRNLEQADDGRGLSGTIARQS